MTLKTTNTYPNLTPENALKRMRADKVRETVLAAVSADFRSEVPRPLLPGGEITALFGDDGMRARVLFDRRHLEVQLLSPVCATTGRRSVLSPAAASRFPSRALVTEDGAATPACVEKALSLLKELYCDWYMMSILEPAIRQQYERFLAEEPEVRRKEALLNAPVLEEIASLRQEKTLLRNRFRAGAMPETAYKQERGRLISLISGKERSLACEDVFGRIFIDELLLLRCVDNPRKLIETVAESAVLP